MKRGNSSTTFSDAETRDLKNLLEAFGSAFSIEDIASAYGKARRNVDMAGEILCPSHGRTFDTVTHTSKDKLECSSSTSIEPSSNLDGASAMPSQVSYSNVLQSSHLGGRNIRSLKSKVHPVSIGTVSGSIGKASGRATPVTNEYPVPTKPPKLDLKDLPLSEISSEEVSASMRARKSIIHGDVEDFMFEMLGDGFHLDKNAILEVLGLCDYDVQKSMEKLLDLSKATLKRRDDVVDFTGKRSSGKQDVDSPCSSKARVSGEHLTESPKSDKDSSALQKQILEALFSVPKRSEEAPKRTHQVREVGSSGSYGKVVVEPLADTSMEHKSITAKPLEVATEHLTESPKSDKDSSALQKQILEALFSVPKRSEEAPKRTHQVREVGSSGSYGKVVVEPLADTSMEHKSITAKPLEVATEHLTESPKSDKDRSALQKQILEALFSVPKRSEEAPKITHQVRDVGSSRSYGKVVVEPLADTAIEHKSVTAKPLEVATDEDEKDENSYEVLRKSVKEYWMTMKEYNDAAVDAFVKGNLTQTKRFLEQGNFFNRKAREADEKSTQKLLEISQGDEVSLDLRNYGRKEVLRLLRLLLTCPSGIPAFKFLKIIVKAGDEDTKKGAQKQLILKELEKESLKWTEVDDQTILVLVDAINPKHLGFSEK